MSPAWFVFYLTLDRAGWRRRRRGAALYGHYRVLPAWLTGPEVCLMEDGGCAVLFRSPRARLLGVPNALLGVVALRPAGGGPDPHWPRVAAVRDDAAGDRDERVPRLQPAHAQPAVPHLLDRTRRQRDAGAHAVRCARSCHSTLAIGVAAQARRSGRALQTAREHRQRAAGRRHLGRSAGEGREGLRVGVEAGARALLARHARAGDVAQGLPRVRASPPAAPRSRSRRTSPKGTSGSPPTWARWPSRSACGRG